MKISNYCTNYYRMANLTAYGGSSVAAKIMARYGFKDGQGLGKQEQGMSMALQVEKTSKRGGRIVHEKDISMLPPPGELPASSASAQALPATEPSITEIMKSPSKVVLLRVRISIFYFTMFFTNICFEHRTWWVRET